MENFKIRIKTESDSYFIQKMLHRCGVQWFGNSDSEKDFSKKNDFIENIGFLSVMKRQTGIFMHFSVTEYAFNNLKDPIKYQPVKEVDIEGFIDICLDKIKKRNG